MMKFLNALTGSASEIDVQEVTAEHSKLLAEGERFERAYKLIRDLILFTNKRLIRIDIQGLSGKKAEYLSVPYQKIAYFSVTTAGTIDVDAELRLGIPGGGGMELRFGRDIDIFKVQAILAAYVMN